MLFAFINKNKKATLQVCGLKEMENLWLSADIHI